MEKKYDVCGIGNALVDYEIEVTDQFFEDNKVEKGLMTLVDEPRQAELISKSKGQIKKRQSGGSGANSIYAVAQLGGKGYYTCRVSKDDDGSFYMNDLKANGIETNISSDLSEEGVTGKCLIMITPDAERTMNTYLGISADLSVDNIHEEAIKASKYVFLEGFPVSSPQGVEALKKVKAVAEQNEVKVAMTFSDPAMVKYFNENVHDVIGNGVDLLFCNIEEGELFTGKSGIDEVVEALKKTAKHFVVTLGEEGAVAFDGNEVVTIDPVPVKAVDSTGAGDMFAGAYIYGLIAGFSSAKSGKLASAASSAVVGQFGPRLEQSIIDSILASIKE